MMPQVFVWHASDVLAGVAAIVAIAAACVLVAKEWVEQKLCKHDKGVSETRSCDAICRGCGKNLGFIGTWREAQKEKK